MSERGNYLIFEGADGTGKSTQVDLMQTYLRDTHGIHSIQIHEPDGFEGDEMLGLPAVTGATELRKIIKNSSIDRDPWTNVILFTAARRMNWLQAIEPALAQGVWVMGARNYISTVNYQGSGEGIDINQIIEYTRDNVGEQYMNPDLTVVLALGNEAVRSGRIANRGALEQPDTFESKPAEFQVAMQNGYIDYATKHGIPILDASGSTENIHTALVDIVRRKFNLG